MKFVYMFVFCISLSIVVLADVDYDKLVEKYEANEEQFVTDRSMLFGEHESTWWQKTKTVAIIICAVAELVRGGIFFHKRYSGEMVLTPRTLEQQMQAWGVLEEWQRTTEFRLSKLEGKKRCSSVC